MRVRIASLKGTRCEVLQAQAGQYVDGLQANGLHGGVVDLMEGLIRDGKRVLLVSYTLQWLLEAFNRRHAAERVIGSTLQCDANGICTGRYDVQLQSVGKLRCLRDLYDEALVRNAFLLTDDPQADRDIYDFVAHPVALVVGEGK
jgi:phosphoserine phosphatase